MSEYSRPISLMDFQIAIKDSSDEELHNILGKLRLSIHRLEESNKLMDSLMNKEKKHQEELGSDDEFGPVTEEDTKIYLDSINENLTVLRNQKERCNLINDELSYRNVKIRMDEPTTGPEPVGLETAKNPIPISTDNDESY